ncbi:c-type cytochrome [Paraflavisolibacter sp. H34]|uniref:c-type cytochrome n=1 Tax=Huijunlia imazamoxiresistens TaxID=3127457 RepID=UPI00301685A7
MKSVFTVSLLFGAILLMSFALSKEEVRYKNLKVLPKNTNKQQMDSVMKHFSQSLGVRCNFCHVFNQAEKAMDFASDNNEHKQIAREMMKMTNKLNKKSFNIKHPERLDSRLEVTCYSCHHGSAHVAHKPQVGEQRAPREGQPGGQPGGFQGQRPPGADSAAKRENP